MTWRGKGKRREGERERAWEQVLSLIYRLAPNGQQSGKQKPGARNSTMFPTWLAGDPSPWPCHFAGAPAGGIIKNKVAGTQTATLIWDVDISGGSLIHCAVMPSSSLFTMPLENEPFKLYIRPCYNHLNCTSGLLYIDSNPSSRHGPWIVGGV